MTHKPVVAAIISWILGAFYHVLSVDGVFGFLVTSVLHQNFCSRTTSQESDSCAVSTTSSRGWGNLSRPLLETLSNRKSVIYEVINTPR